MAAMPGQAPMIPPPGAAPADAGMAAPAEEQAPAAEILPIIAMLAQQQTAVMQQENQRQMMMREMMKEQILRVISMTPVANPAGVAARTEPMPAQMPPNTMAGGEDMEDDMDEGEMEGEMY